MGSKVRSGVMKRFFSLLFVLLFAVGCAESTLESTSMDDADEPSTTVPQPADENSTWWDSDGDGVVDRQDNCKFAQNPGQEDSDRDSVGDACDNCRNVANVTQSDVDGNGIGDDCQVGDAPDTDGDGVADVADNCPNAANPDQTDTDFDLVGDACDNCPTASNAAQSDDDGNGVGNACDPNYQGDICYSEQFNPDVTTIEPALLLMLDASGSMADQLDPGRPRPWPIDLAQDAIGNVADQLADEAWIGLSQFPNQTAPGSTCTTADHLSVAANSATAIKNAVADVTAIGNTPTGHALNSVLDRSLLSNGNDAYDSRRPKGVILITDGDPTVACDTGSAVNLRVEAQPEAVAAAARLNAAGIPVYVIGFMSGAEPANLNQIAAAGGTNAPGANNFYVADDTTQLVAAIQTIKQEIISCSYQLGAVPNDMDSMVVTVDGAAVADDPVNGYSYDPFARLVTLNGSACDGIKNAADPSQKQIQVEITCVDPGECQPVPEVCDNMDNDCDGQADEHDVCTPPSNGPEETCNGFDDDGDGQIDEGCPACSLNNETCVSDADCCFGECSFGLCQAQCRPAEVACISAADCCSGACSGSPTAPGVCLAQ